MPAYCHAGCDFAAIIDALRRLGLVAGNGRCVLPCAIIGAPLGLDVDHKDGNSLNNRRLNMRLATVSQNQHNARTRIDSTTGVKGVGFHKATGMWQAKIRLRGRLIWLGRFPTIPEATAAYAEASARLHGKFRRIA